MKKYLDSIELQLFTKSHTHLSSNPVSCKYYEIRHQGMCVSPEKDVLSTDMLVHIKGYYPLHSLILIYYRKRKMLFRFPVKSGEESLWKVLSGSVGLASGLTYIKDEQQRGKDRRPRKTAKL